MCLPTKPGLSLAIKDCLAIRIANCYHSGASNATRENLKILTSYKIGTRNRKLTTDLQTLQPFIYLDEERNKEFTCLQPWFYPKSTTNGSAICKCGRTLGWMVQCTVETHLQVQSCYLMKTQLCT